MNNFKILQSFAKHIPLSFLIKATRQKIFMPFYHTLLGNQSLPHVEHLYTLRTKKQFIADLDFLLKHYQAISINDLWNHTFGEKEITKNYFFLSFDDGLREVYDIAAPILLQKGIPATLFVNSAFVDNKDLFFRYKVSLLIDAIKKKNLEKEVKKKLNAITNKIQIDSTSSIYKNLLNISYSGKSVLDQLAEIVEIDFTHFLKKQKPYLTTNQLLDLQSKGFNIGAHSVDHPLYHQISKEAQMNQTTESIDFVQKQFNPTYKSFAFPFTDFGVKDSFFQKIKKEQIANFTFGGAGLKNEKYNFHFHRYMMEGKDYSAKDLLSTEYFYYFAKMFFRKNTIRRK